MTSRSRYALGAGLISAALFVLLFIQITWLNGAWMLLRANLMAWVIVGGIIFSVIMATRAYSTMGSRNTYYGRSEPAVKMAFWPWVSGAVVGVLGLTFIISFAGYAKNANVNESNSVLAAEDNRAQMPEYKTRAPYVVAEQQTLDNTTINGTAEDTTYVPELGKYGAAVVKSGWIKGYGQVVWQEIGDTGQAKLESCAFAPTADDRMGGMFTHNLERRIIHEDFGIRIDNDDTYAYCNDEGEPIVVVPFTKFKGFLFPIEVPAGVALYNGSTDELEVLHDVKPGEVPGPVYPISLAEQARNATRADAGWWSYLQKAVGYSEYGGTNSSDYTLRRLDDSGDSYVTPLVMKGKGKAITSVGYVESNGFTAGQLNPYYIAQLPQSRQGDSAVQDRTTTDYPELNWASGLQIFEIAPTGPDTWAATIGKSKSIAYKLEINADSSSCLFNTRGVKIRCTGDEEVEGEETPTTPDTDPTSVLSELTNEELVQLQEKVQEEIVKRLNEAPVAE